MESRKGRRNIRYKEEEIKGKNKWKLICLISLILMFVIYNQVYILFKYTTGQNVTEKQIRLYKWVTSLSNNEAEVDEEGKLDIGVLGNIALSDKLQKSYLSNNESNIDEVFKYVELSGYDFVVANLDMTLKNNDMTTKEVINEFNRLKINVLNIANEEIAYSEKQEIEETIDVIKENNIDYIGTKKQDKNYYILEKNNIKIAFLSYLSDEYGEHTNLNTYLEKELDKDLQQIKKEKVDGVILFIDTLRSNKEKVDNDKKELLKQILEKDVDVIVSSDTVSQEIYTRKDGQENKYVAYSLGDFIGHQKNDNSDISKLLKISIDKKKVDGSTNTTFDVTFDKIFVALSNSDVTKCKVVDLEKEIKKFDENKEGNITMAEYYYLLNVKKNLGI